MANVTVTNTPVPVGDGTKNVFVLPPKEPYMYGFGNNPTIWVLQNDLTKPTEFGTAYGQLNLRTVSTDNSASSISIEYILGV